jgi:hypothetical protein
MRKSTQKDIANFKPPEQIHPYNTPAPVQTSIGGDSMSHKEQNVQIQAYFDSLPPYLQETIRQSGAKYQTLNDLKALCRNLMQPD